MGASIKKIKTRRAASPEQLAAIRESVPVLADGFIFARRSLAKGLTEHGLASNLRQYFRQRGYSNFAFDFIVAFGASSAEPHHQPGNKKLKPGQFLKIDMGLSVRGWKTDVTRTFVFGRPTTKQRRIHSLVLQAQSRAIAAVRAGVLGRDVDAAARNFLTKKGFGREFVHSTGHGLGRSIHQAPWLSPKKGNQPLRAGQVVTVEPGIYFKGWGGVRIEDMVLVTPQGSQVLSRKIPVSSL